MHLPGTPSDEVSEILATGSGDITTMFISMASRHPEGKDAEYLRWHTLDHRPEQHRLSTVRASLRLVSTPECRAARAANDHRFAAIDYVMTYFFTDRSGLSGFNALSKALDGANRKLALLPPVQRGVYTVQHKGAAERVKVGADVLPWWPASGVYVLLEAGAPARPDLMDLEGVAGVWSATSHSVSAELANAPAGQTLSYVFLDDDPVTAAERLRPALEKRWSAGDIEPLFAAPFHPVIPHEWNRYLP